MKAGYFILSIVVSVAYFMHGQDHEPDMRGLHMLVIWAGLLIAGAK